MGFISFDSKPSVNYILPNLTSQPGLTKKRSYDKTRKKLQSGGDVFPGKQLAGKRNKSN
jgi:hypothetical protein